MYSFSVGTDPVVYSYCFLKKCAFKGCRKRSKETSVSDLFMCICKECGMKLCALQNTQNETVRFSLHVEIHQCLNRFALCVFVEDA